MNKTADKNPQPADPYAFGLKTSDVLCHVSEKISEWDLHYSMPVGFREDGFEAAIKILMSAIYERMYMHQETEKMNAKERKNMMKKLNEGMQKVIRDATGIHIKKLY